MSESRYTAESLANIPLVHTAFLLSTLHAQRDELAAGLTRLLKAADNSNCCSTACSDARALLSKVVV